MSTQGDVRRLALKLPGVVEATDHFGFFVTDGTKERGFAWAWPERIDPKKPKVENRGVLDVRVANKDVKEQFLATGEAKFFTEPHYKRFRAVLVRLEQVNARELGDVLAEAWRCIAWLPGNSPFDLEPAWVCRCARGTSPDGLLARRQFPLNRRTAPQ